MSETPPSKLFSYRLVKTLWTFLGGVKLPGFSGLTLLDLLKLYTLGIAKGAISTRASAIAFSFFMAIFPFLLFVLFLIPIIPIAGFEQEFMAFLESFLPPQTSDFFFDNIFGNLNSGQTQGGVLSSVFLLSILLMANGVNAVFTGFETSYHEQLSRNFFKQYLYALGVALLLAFLLVITVAFWGYFEIYVIQNIHEQLELRGITSSESELIWAKAGKYLFFVLIVYVATAILYYYGTSEGKALRFFSAGALLTTILIILTSYLFGVYINNFSNYNELYGSIGALLILLFYLWLNANILLLGYELNASLTLLKKRQTTT
jgi:membrane protein